MAPRMTRDDWFDGALDEWRAWTEQGPSRAPSPGFASGVREWEPSLLVPSFEAALAAAQRSVHGPLWLCALLDDLHLLWAERGNDERCYLATAPDTSGHCRVFLFDPRHNCLATHAWPSIRAWLSALEADEGPTMIDHDHAPRARQRAWLASALLGIGYATPAEDVADASPFSDFEAEPRSVGDALYWLWHHAIAGNDRALAALLERCPGLPCGTDPRVRDSIAWLSDHARPGRWDAAFAGLGRERVAALRDALDLRCLEGPRVPLAEPASPAKGGGADQLDELDAWLRDHAQSQREGLQALATVRRAELLALYRAQPEPTAKLLRKRITSKKLVGQLAALIAELEAER
jgi:hypothetical protein